MAMEAFYNESESEIYERYVKYFLFTLMAICFMGVIMVYSASYIYAKEVFGNSAYYFNKQIVFLLVSSLMAFIMSKTKISFWFKYASFFQGVSLFLLLLTLFPGLGLQIKGARRWLQLGPIGIQPGEFVKYTTLLFSVIFFEKFNTYTSRIKVLSALLLFIPFALLLAQPDFGSFSICFAVLAITCFFSSFSRKYFYSAFIAGVIGIIPILISQPYRVRRLFAYLDPWKNPQTSGFQIIQSYLAFANGSFFGLGLGNSHEKLFYLPEAHNDFVFSVIGEELGFAGVITLIAMFIGLIYLGLRLSLFIKSKMSFILVASIISTIGLQTFLNMAVVLGLLPTKGLNLPFISAGGSSLLANFFAVGLIFSAIRAQRELDNSHESIRSGPSFFENQRSERRDSTNADLFGNFSD